MVLADSHNLPCANVVVADVQLNVFLRGAAEKLEEHSSVYTRPVWSMTSDTRNRTMAGAGFASLTETISQEKPECL